MIRIFISIMAAVGLLFACGCASQMESVNQGANQAGQTSGRRHASTQLRQRRRRARRGRPAKPEPVRPLADPAAGTKNG